MPERGVVDEAEERAELLAQIRARRIGNLVDLAEVEGHEMQRAGCRARSLCAIAAVTSLLFLRATAMTR